MKSVDLVWQNLFEKEQPSDKMIRVYRFHAARALTEERWSVAEIFLDRILEVEPERTEAWLMKGLLRQHCREDDEAAAGCFHHVLRICDRNPDHPHALRARNSLGQLQYSLS